MRIFHLVVMLSGMSVLLWSCKQSSVGPDATNSKALVDTLTIPITVGVTLQVDQLKDFYSLNDIVTGTLLLTNQGDPIPFCVNTSNIPPHTIMVFEVPSGELVYFFPSVVYPAEVNDTLHFGDSLSLPVQWSQTTFSQTEMRWTNLQAYSGEYRLKVFLGGNPKLYSNHLTKYLTITETGEPLCLRLRVDYSSNDSLIADVIIRNRISRLLAPDFIDPNPITIAFVNKQDTLVSFKHSISPANHYLAAHSDIPVLSLRLPKSDSTIALLNGRFDMRAILHLKAHDLVASAFRYLP